MFCKRVPFLVVGIPALVCAVLVWLLVEEVQRGHADRNHIELNSIEENDQDALEMKELGTTDECKLKRAGQNANGSGAYIKLDNQAPTPSDHSALSAIDGRIVYTAYLKPHWTTLKALSKCHSVKLLLLQGAPGCVPWGIINTYLNDYLSSDRGMSVEVRYKRHLIFQLLRVVSILLYVRSRGQR